MRYILPILSVALVACGGGGVDTSPSLQSAALEGVIYELDGQTLDRSGVGVTVLETGESVVTSTDGIFTFASVPSGTVTLQFESAATRLAHNGDGGDDGSQQEQSQEQSQEQEQTQEQSQEQEEPEQEQEQEQSQEQEQERVGDSEGEQERERERAHEHECDEDCEHANDGEGETRLVQVRERERIRVRCAMDDGQITEFSSESEERHRSRARLERAEGSPDPDVEGKVRVRSEFQHEKFDIEAENLAPGTQVEFLLDDPSDGNGFVPVGTAVANSEGEAEMERDRFDGDRLPMGVDSVAELAGFGVQVRLANGGALLLQGEVPDLPSQAPIGDGTPRPGDPGRGKSELAPLTGDDVQCEVEIRSRPDRGEERFRMEAEHLSPGTEVAFEIENPDTGEFVRFGRAVADDNGEAEVSTQDGLAMPLGAQGVDELTGLQVRVVLGGDSGRILCAGFVPALVAD